MRGKNTFTPVEIERVKSLLEKKADARPMVQRRVREQLRRVGFYISDYDYTFAAFTPEDLDSLIKSGRITVEARADAPSPESGRRHRDKPAAPSPAAGQSSPKKSAAKKEPSFRPPMLVTAAIIRDGGKVLLTQRKKGSHLPDKWEFPGGKVEAGESPEACLKRELKEEIGVEAKVGDIFKVVYYHYSRGPILLLAYWVEIDLPPQAIDCQAVEWVEINSLDDTKFSPADLPVLNKLRYGIPSSVPEEIAAPRGFKRLLGLFGDRS